MVQYYQCSFYIVSNLVNSNQLLLTTTTVFFSFFCQFFLENRVPGAARREAYPGLAMRRALDGPPDGRLRRLYFLKKSGKKEKKKNLQKNLQIFAKNGFIFGSIRVLEQKICKILPKKWPYFWDNSSLGAARRVARPGPFVKC